ncbi:MAG: DUF2298 domain-containing protein, partial [Vicinamibacterales bacterium]
MIGLLYASNSWDAPAGMLLVVGGIALGSRFDWRIVARDTAVVVVGALVAAAPFIAQFNAPVGVTNADLPGWLTDLPLLGRLFSTFGIVTWRPSSVRELLVVHGVWLAAFAGFAAIELWRDRSLVARIRRGQPLWLAGAILTLGVAMAWAPAIAVLGAPLLLATWQAARGQGGARVIAGLFAIGFLLALVPEFVFIQDVFADRMNTVFKLYFQAWLLLSLASAAGVAHIFRQAPPRAHVPAAATAVVVVAAALTYLPLSAQDWTNDFDARRGLDGGAYIDRVAPGEYAAIQWLSRHANPGDAVVEAPGCSYINVAGLPTSRLSAFSGVPTLVGWWGHE